VPGEEWELLIPHAPIQTTPVEKNDWFTFSGHLVVELHTRKLDKTTAHSVDI
jgi:hypothetical protein